MLSGQPTLTGPVIFEAAANGDSLAQDVVERYCRYLAKGLTSFQFAFDPESFVLGGGVSEVGELLLEGIRCALLEQDRHIRLLLASLGNDAGSSGRRCSRKMVCSANPLVLVSNATGYRKKYKSRLLRPLWVEPVHTNVLLCVYEREVWRSRED